MQRTDLKRRAFLRGKSPRVEPDTIRPPWALDASLFIDKCTRCDACINACPEKIIKRGDGGYPQISFQQGECTFCAKCFDVCEAGAFIALPTEKPQGSSFRSIRSVQPWRLQVSFKTNCLALNAVVCRSCGDNCDEQAIGFQLKVGGISEPQLVQENCTGCGACLPVCPVHAVQIKPRTDQTR